VLSKTTHWRPLQSRIIFKQPGSLNAVR
jgi:hypothetical protein